VARNLNGTTDELTFAVATDGLVGMTHGTYAAIARVEDTGIFRTLWAVNTTGGTFVVTPMQINDIDSVTWDGDAGVAIPINVWLVIIVRKNTGTVLPRFSVYRYDTGAWSHSNGPATHGNHTSLTTGHEVGLQTGSGSELFDGDVTLMAAWKNHLPWAPNADGDVALEQSGIQWDLLAWLNSYGHKSGISFVGAGAGALTATSGAALTPANPAGIDAGDLLIAHVFYGGSTAAPNTPTDWTLLDGPRSLNTPGTNGRAWVFGKKAVGGDANPAFGTQAVTTPRRARVYAWHGVRDDTVANIVGGFGFAGPASSSTISDVGVTTIDDNAMAIQLLAIADDNAMSTGWSGGSGGPWPDTPVVTAFTGTTGTPDTHMACYQFLKAAAGTIDGYSRTQSAADPWGIVGFYIRPSIGGVAANPPSWLVLLDQSDVGQSILDITGNGGNQSGLTGTTIATSDPPGFGYGADPIVSPGHAAAAGAVALEGVSSAVAEHAGALSLALTLEGTSGAIADNAGLLSLALPLEGVSSTVAEHAGTLGLAIPLTGVTEIVSEHAGALSLAIGLAGASDAVAEHSGSLNLAVALVGASSAIADHVAQLSLALALDGVSSTIAEHAGLLSLALPLEGTSNAVAEHSGLLGLALPLVGVSEAVAEHGADLTLQGQVQLEGAVETVAEHSGSLILAIDLTGASDSVAEHAGTLELIKFMDGVSSAVAEHSGSLSLTLELVGQSSAVAEHSGVVSLQVGLVGVSSAVAEHVGDLSLGSTIELDGAVSAVAEMAGDLSIGLSIELVGAVEAVAQMTGILDLIPAIFSGDHLGYAYGVTDRLLPGQTRSHLGRRASTTSHLGGGS
jgi:hypothetical protein